MGGNDNAKAMPQYLQTFIRPSCQLKKCATGLYLTFLRNIQQQQM